MPRGEYLKYKKEDILKRLEGLGVEWISGEYVNRNSKIIVKSKEGYYGLCTLGVIMPESRKKDNVRFFQPINPYTTDNIKTFLKNNNSKYKLLSTTYTRNTDRLIFKCPEHGEFKQTWNTIKQGGGCQICGGTVKYTIEEVKNIMFEINNNIEILSDKYVNVFAYLKCKCLIDGHIWESNFHNLNTNKNGCPECKRRSFLGENNHRYNPDLTDEERINGRSIEGYWRWNQDVKIRDNFTCQRCGEKDIILNSHHINSYNSNEEGRTDLDNGVCLCELCHREFHTIYGYGNNNTNQYNNWMKNYKVN